MAAEPLNLILVSFLCCLVIADGILTYEILCRGGKELNPVVRWAIEKLGIVEGLVLTRMVLVLVFIVSVQSMPAWGFFALIVFYAFVIAHNAKQLIGDR